MADLVTPSDGGIEDVPRRAAGARAIKIMTYDELLARPEPDWLVEGVVPGRSVVVLWGLPATGKSFVALSMALSIAAGVSWLGWATTPGAVAYVAAEGDRGVPRRIRAWLVGRDPQVEARVRTDLRVVPQPIEVLQSQELALIDEFTTLGFRPRLVVIDTASRCMAGGEENSSREMSRLVQSCDGLRDATEAAVLLVHHADKSGSTPRGSSVLHGAADTMIHVVKQGDGVVRLICTKQKDAEEFGPIAAKLETVRFDVAGRETSCRLAAAEGVDDKWQVLRPATRKVCDVLRTQSAADGLTADQLADATKLNRKTVYAAVGQAEQADYVTGVPSTRPERFVATASLLERSSPSSPPFSASSRRSDPTDSPSSSPLKGETETRNGAEERATSPRGARSAKRSRAPEHAAANPSRAAGAAS